MAVRRPSRGRLLPAAVLAVALAVPAGCSDDVAEPTPPSPGPLTAGGSAAVVSPPFVEGSGVTAPGIRLTAAPRGDGSFDVVEEVVLRGETSAVQLRPPPSGERLQGMMARTDPQATGLRLVADGDQVRLPETTVRSLQEVPLEVAVTRLKLTYRLNGSTVRSLPSRVGRALGVISPLATPTDGTLPTNLTVSGGGLLNAVCPLLPETRCAVGEPPGLGIQQGIPADRALAVLQLDLPMRP